MWFMKGTYPTPRKSCHIGLLINMCRYYVRCQVRERMFRKRGLTPQDAIDLCRSNEIVQEQLGKMKIHIGKIPECNAHGQRQTIIQRNTGIRRNKIGKRKPWVNANTVMEIILET